MLTFASFKRTNDCFTDFKKAKKMKKLVFMFVAIAAISFASCGNNNKPAENADTTATDTAVQDTNVQDTTVQDSANAEAAPADSNNVAK